MKIAIAQINSTVGDLRENRRLVQEAAEEALLQGAELILLPELTLTGYAPMDLLSNLRFIEEQIQEIRALREWTRGHRGFAIALGAALPGTQGSLHNCALLLTEGLEWGMQRKRLLPTYDVFDEKRYFTPGRESLPIEWKGVRIGLTICEDGWADELGYAQSPTRDLAELGADLILNLSASPWQAGKTADRRRIFQQLAKDCGKPIFLANQVGGNDELIFDGGSFAADAQGRIQGALPGFQPGMLVLDHEHFHTKPRKEAEETSQAAQLESALVLGIRDYFHKQSLPQKAVIGISGGIDSAVAAHLACKALGPENVLGLAMPGPYSSDHSVEDALQLAKNLGMTARMAPIKGAYKEYLKSFREFIADHAASEIYKENIQSRIRGNLLMATSNAECCLVIATGNKSELSLGYCTLYGDMAGGLAVLGDVLKRDVYQLAEHANEVSQREGKGDVIPRNTIDKPPSAELAPNQLDQDELPPYEQIDNVLAWVLEQGRSPESLTSSPENLEDIQDILRRVNRNEYKRRQAPPVLRISQKAFGTGRRMPIVHRWED